MTKKTDDESHTDLTLLTECPIGAMGRLRASHLLNVDNINKYINTIQTVCGWSRSVRKQGKGKCFIDLTDGSTPKPLQIVVDTSLLDEQTASKIQAAGVYCSMKVVGKVVRNLRDESLLELKVDGSDGTCIEVFGQTNQSDYPLAKKAHTVEFLRGLQHMRPRTTMFSAIFRIRSALAFSVHLYFQTKGYQYIHTPLITAADCEGAGEMFSVTTLMPESKKISDIPSDQQGNINYQKDFFKKPVSLTVSGQLAVENFCQALCDVYTFGPTFRAENSHTARHLAEFWMIEPEIAFADLEYLMIVAEDFLKFCANRLLSTHKTELEYLQKSVKPDLIASLESFGKDDFARISYSEAVEILKKQTNEDFPFMPEFGSDLCSAHERFLCEKYFKRATIVYDYPYELKAFYMKVNPDGKTVRAMDILVPGIGELVGGSQREENLDLLMKQMKDKNIPKEDLEWYLELRTYGTIPHSGFGVGFERLVMLCTGIDNIRDVIPYPRFPGCAQY